MKITLKNIGALKGEVVLAPARLTVLSGGNNTGKTYAMYVLWALLQRRARHVFGFAEELAVQLKTQGTVELPLEVFFTQHWHTIERGIADGLTDRLGPLFRAPAPFFKEGRVKLSIDLPEFLDFAKKHERYKRTIEVGDSSRLDIRFSAKEGPLAMAVTSIGAVHLPQSLVAELLSQLVIELALAPQVEGAFLLPAERGGLNLFYLDLDAKNSALVRHLKRDDVNPVALFQDMMVAQYAEPIEAYIQFLRRAPRMTKSEGAFHDQAMALQKNVARVRYKVGKDGDITAKPYRSDAELSIHLTSSAVKSFYGLWAWLELQAKPGDCLMIDEPELNLHPDNQRLVARLLVRLVNRGIRVVISTHSDYIVREINNMIMLNSEFHERTVLEAKLGYDPTGTERLDAAQVAAYHFSDKGVENSVVSPAFGIEVKSMDEAIHRLNESNSEIYFALADAQQPIASPEQVEMMYDAK